MNPTPPAPETPRRTIRDLLWAEIDAMATHAASSGHKLPGSVGEVLGTAGTDRDNIDISQLLAAHSELARLIAPATPRLILALAEDAQRRRSLFALGRLPLLRQLLVLAAIGLASFIGLSLSHHINDPGNARLFESSGVPLLINELFFLAAAAIGAAFSGLYRADREIKDGTFDPGDQASYWSRLMLGLTAGLLLATFFDLKAASLQLSGVRMSEATLALLGGFSSSAIYRILNRLVDTLETLVGGGGEEKTAASRRGLETTVQREVAIGQEEMARRLASLHGGFSDGDSRGPGAGSSQDGGGQRSGSINEPAPLERIGRAAPEKDA